jgi:uncharacterized protein (DUF486 family)
MDPVFLRHAALTFLGLFAAGLFMNLAWYLHLGRMSSRPLWVAVLVSWGIALFEYALQVPTNRYGDRHLSLATLKIFAEIASLLSFAVVSVAVLGKPVDRNYALAGALVVLAGWIVVRRPLG